MGEWRDKEPLMWKLLEGLVLGLLVLLASVVAIIEIITEGIKSWWRAK